MTWKFLLGNNTTEKALVVPLTLMQDPHGSFKVSYPAMHIVANQYQENSRLLMANFIGYPIETLPDISETV